MGRSDQMNEPPLMLDGTRVLEFAHIDASGAGARRRTVVAEGVPMSLDTVSRLAIAEDLAKGGVFLMHCNDDWETLTAGHYTDAAMARESARGVYADLGLDWIAFRALTPAETKEVETTRAFLREIAAEFPSD